jgi:hypothetical protein
LVLYLLDLELPAVVVCVGHPGCLARMPVMGDESTLEWPGKMRFDGMAHAGADFDTHTS